MEGYEAGSSFHGSLPQRLTTTPFTSLPPKSHLKEPPVSSYLRPAVGAVTLDNRGRHRSDDAEIGIFDAERYFSQGKHAVKVERCHLSAHQGQFSANGYGRHGLAGSCCSMVSRNSQSSLLSDPPASDGAVRVLLLKELGKSPSFHCRRFFARKCLCSGEKSVEVVEKFSVVKSPSRPNLDLNTNFAAKKPSFRTLEPGLSGIPERAKAEVIENEFAVEETLKMKITPGDAHPNPSFLGSSAWFSLNRPSRPEVGRRMVSSGIRLGDSGGFSFPILNPLTFNSFEEPPRASPEVFPPEKAPAVVFPVAGDKDWRCFTYPAKTTSSPDDDEASDASSDLFELESLCTQTTYHCCDSFNTRNQIRPEAAAPSIAPSEASVTTAEGDRAGHANISSSASNCSGQRFAKAQDERLAAAAGIWRWMSVILLRCRSEKAVRVGPNPNQMEFEPVRSRQSGRVRSVEFVGH